MWYFSLSCPVGYTLRAMEHRFSGPSYTLGIEEELMIVDEETLDLVEFHRAAARRPE